jgi:hypothetical protein
MVYVCRYNRNFDYNSLVDSEDCERLNFSCNDNTDKGNNDTTSSNEKIETKSLLQKRRQPRRFFDYNFVKQRI